MRYGHNLHRWFFCSLMEGNLGALVQLIDHPINYTHLMFEHTHIGMALYDALDFRLLSANAAFRQQAKDYLQHTGEKRDTLLGQPFTVWIQPRWKEQMLTTFQQVVASGEPFHNREYAAILPSLCLTYWNWSLHPIRDEDGHIRYLLQTTHEVTDQVAARQRESLAQEPPLARSLLDSEQNLLRTLLNQFSEGVLVTEVLTGATSYANEAAARLLGLPLSTLLATPLHKHSWPHGNASGPFSTTDAPVPWLFPIIHALCGETVQAQETMLARPDGSTRSVLTSSIPLRTEQGIILGAVVILREVAPCQVRTCRSVRESATIFSASHELRTPTTTIQGIAELLQLSISRGQSLSSSRIQRMLERLSEQSQHLSFLVNALLDVSLLEHEQFELSRTSCDLLPLVVSGLEHFSLNNNSPKHTFHLSLQGSIATGTLLGRFDKERVTHLVQHLISNAIKYSPNGGHIEVTLSHSSERAEVTLSVQDEGIGIAPHELPRLFERFYRASTLDTSINGLGIGLYLVKEIVTGHKGRVWVKSTEGQGATFFVALPLEDTRE
jgi:signal transduction histidine kinase